LISCKLKKFKVDLQSSMAKKITKKIKVQIEAGKATPAGTLGPALGQAGVNIGDFVTKFNATTQKMMGDKVGVVITVYEDRSYDFIIKTPPVTGLILKAAGVEKGSGKNAISKVGKITRAQAEEIAKKKMTDLNAKDIEGAVAIVAGSARSMGIEVK
jgi:large subunit ribosomal protein L11